VQRVLVLGRGGSGKTSFARRLSEISGLPLIELDSEFWQPNLAPLSADAWAARQYELAAGDAWIMDGDLGPYDVLEPRLRRADTIFLLDFSLWRCAWRSLRRGRERGDYWKWVVTYRIRYLPTIKREIGQVAPDIDLRLVPRPHEIAAILTEIQ
jgi:adenylate kinase family enzyme